MQAHREGGQSIASALAHSQVPLVWCPRYVTLASLFPSLVCLSPCISPHQRTGVAGGSEVHVCTVSWSTSERQDERVSFLGAWTMLKG